MEVGITQGRIYVWANMGRDPRNLIYAMLQFDSVIQSLLFFLLEPNLFISFDMYNDMIDFSNLYR